jgi:hypothetical protein
VPFSPAIATSLYDAVGGRCSSPTCQRALRRPGEPGTVGEAAHIKGEGPGVGPKTASARYDSLQDEDERKSERNGIWLCRNCHRFVDRCAGAFPPELLDSWKDDARKRWLEESSTSGPRSIQGTVDLGQDRVRARNFHRRHLPLAVETSALRRGYAGALDIPVWERLRRAAYSAEPLMEPFNRDRVDCCYEPLTLAYQMEMVRLVELLRSSLDSPLRMSANGETINVRTRGVDEDGIPVYVSGTVQALIAHTVMHDSMMKFVDTLQPAFGVGRASF